MLEKKYNKHILKRWSNDFNIPIKIYEEPYFSYFIELYDNHFGTKRKLNFLNDALAKFESAENFLAYNNKVTDNIVSYIVSKKEYSDFLNVDMDKFSVESSYPKNDIYNKHNTGKYFVSIDLVKANFQTLNYINSNLTDGLVSYEDFIAKFTDLDYIKKSKYIRQIIFGKLNPKRQIKIARFLIEKIINYLLEKELIDKEKIVMASSDEFIFEVEEDKLDKFINMDENLRSIVKKDLYLDIDIEIFKLNSISDKYFVREFKNKEGYAFSCVPAMYYAQIFKKYNNIDIEDNDLVFVYENVLAKFLEPLF